MPGYKRFSDNQILTAENFMDFLMKQAVISCDDDTARDTYLMPYLREGMVCYLRDVNQLLFYDGQNWQRIGTYDEAVLPYDARPNEIYLNMESRDFVYVYND